MQIRAEINKIEKKKKRGIKLTKVRIATLRLKINK